MMISGTGNNFVSRISYCASRFTRYASRATSDERRATTSDGFTLIEVLLSVAILVIGLTFIVRGYNTLLEAYGKARFVSDGSMILQEKMADSTLKIISGTGAANESGNERGWQWFVKAAQIKDALYELEAEVKRGGGKIKAATYVRK